MASGVARAGVRLRVRPANKTGADRQNQRRMRKHKISLKQADFFEASTGFEPVMDVLQIFLLIRFINDESPALRRAFSFRS
jgi:hypothetical protein